MAAVTYQKIFLNILVSVLLQSFLQVTAYAAGPIVFVTQTPIPQDFANLVSTFGNEDGSTVSAPRGGDLWIRYADGTLKNLTQAAGYGSTGFQGSNSIAVRDPAVHWDGAKIVFSMVIGSASQQYQVNTFYWQLYEVTGLGQNQTPVITKVPNQPAAYNNIMPIYGTDDAILFVSDRPRSGERHLYPQLDEYESTRTNTGLWRLEPATGALQLLDHAPSGVFHPFLDSYGRVLMTRWDHLQRDQQAGGLTSYGAFNYSSELQAANRIATQAEVFPEARGAGERTDMTLNLHTFNHFFPWQVNEDGTDLETLNHIGRHELHDYFDRSFNNDANLVEYYGQLPRFNQNSILNFFHIRESATSPGTYFGIDAPEFQTHSAGQVVRLTAPPSKRTSEISVTYVTHRDTSSTSNSPSSNHSGLYRNPLPLSDGGVLVAHTAETRGDSNQGTRAAPQSRYDFRLKTLTPSGAVMVAGTPLTSGIQKALTYWDPDVMVSFSGNLWELQPVEVVARTRPTRRTAVVPQPELSVFSSEGVSVESFQQFLRDNQLAVIVSRNVTSRDSLDVQQPFNLRVTGTNVQKIPRSGKVYDVSHLQIFQGDQIRGYGGVDTPRQGRRVLAQPLHDGHSANGAQAGAPLGGVNLAADGSVAAFVPARRALTWQLTDPQGVGVVRERYWLTFQPGEIRVCASCHGLSERDQLGAPEPTNPPEALRTLVRRWRDAGGSLPTDPNPNPGPTPTPTPNPSDGIPDEDEGVSVGVFVQTAVNKRNNLAGQMIAKKTINISVQDLNGLARNANFHLRFTVDGAVCSGATKVFQTDAAGFGVVSGKAPSLKRDVTVRVSAISGGVDAGSSEVPFYSGKRKQKALTAKDIRSICGSLQKFKAPKRRK